MSRSGRAAMVAVTPDPAEMIQSNGSPEGVSSKPPLKMAPLQTLAAHETAAGGPPRLASSSAFAEHAV